MVRFRSDLFFIRPGADLYYNSVPLNSLFYFYDIVIFLCGYTCMNKHACVSWSQIWESFRRSHTFCVLRLGLSLSLEPPADSAGWPVWLRICLLSLLEDQPCVRISSLFICIVCVWCVEGNTPKVSTQGVWWRTLGIFLHGFTPYSLE